MAAEGLMMHEDKLDDEDARLAALRRYELRDTTDNRPFERVVELIQQVLGVPMAAVTLIYADTQWLKASRGMKYGETAREEAFCTHTIRQFGPFAVNDARLDPRFADNPMVTGAPFIRSYLGVPLTTPEGYNIGSLCAIDDEPRLFDKAQGEMMRKLAEIVVEQFELQQIARQDSMTGALTRRGFIAELDRELIRGSRYDRPSALVAIDLDHLKAINERYGRAAADALLVSVANCCMANMRRSDIFGRLGGDEFALLLPETDAEEAREAAERMRRTIEATIVQVGGTEVRATVSMGIAPRPAAGETAAAWLADAQAATMDAKLEGRNRVAVARPRNPAHPAATGASKAAASVH